MRWRLGIQCDRRPGGRTLSPGLYKSTSTLALTGDVHLHGVGIYIVQIASGLTVNNAARVVLEDGAHPEWLKFLRLIDKAIPPEKDLHLICANYATHKLPKLQRWLARHKRFHVHFTPTCFT